jgi:hypothetical protein
MKGKFLKLLLAALFLFPVVAHGGSLDDYYLSRFDQIYGANAKRSTLSAQDDAPTERCLTPLYHGVKRDWKQLSNETQQTLAKYLAKPALAGEVVVRSNAGHFFIHYATTGSDAPSLADGNSNGIPDWIETVADVFEAVYSREISAFGYRPPPTSGGQPYDVYLQNIASAKQYGYTQSDAPVNAGSTSYTSFIVIDNDFAESIYLGSSRTPLMALQITAAHEFQHAVQYGYNYYFDIWYAEASATWMEDEVYDSINQLYTYLPPYFSNTTLPLDTAVSITTGGGYGRWIFNRYLVERFNNPIIIMDFWERLRAMGNANNGNDIPMLPVIDAVLKSNASSLATDFFSFCKRLYVRDWTSHTSEIDLIHQVTTVATYGSYPITSASLPIPTVTLPHYSFAYFKFQSSASAPQDLQLKFSKSSGIQVTAFKKGKDGAITEYLLDPVTGTITVPDFNTAGTAEVMLLICNNSAADGQTVTFSTDGSSPPLPAPVAAVGGGGGCFIATAAYGSYLHPKVMALRAFRDNYLMTNIPGRAFVSLYYRLSPPLADFIARHEWLRTGCRIALTPVVLAVENKGIALFLILLAGLVPFGLRMRGELYQFQIKAPSSLARLRLLNIQAVCLRRLNPRRLDCIFDLKLVLIRWDKRLTNSGEIVYSIHAKAVSTSTTSRNCLINLDTNTQEEEK